jgi:hypothetical protein
MMVMEPDLKIGYEVIKNHICLGLKEWKLPYKLPSPPGALKTITG